MFGDYNDTLMKFFGGISFTRRDFPVEELKLKKATFSSLLLRIL